MKRRRFLWAGLLGAAGWGVAQAGAYEDFFRAVKLDNARTVESLLQRGFDPNARDSYGQPALVLALREACYRVALVLAQARDLKVEERNPRDESALMMAALQGQLEIARVLIERDADVNKTGWTPLHYAASSTAPEAPQMMALLLEESAYIDAASPNGSTPLMMAVRYGQGDVARLLLREGADPTLRNELGLSALEFARQAGREDMEQLIAQAVRERQPHRGQW